MSICDIILITSAKSLRNHWRFSSATDVGQLAYELAPIIHPSLNLIQTVQLRKKVQLNKNITNMALISPSYRHSISITNQIVADGSLRHSGQK